MKATLNYSEVNSSGLYYPALISFFVLFFAWLYFFWPSLVVFFKTQPSLQVFIFNSLIIFVTLYLSYRERQKLQRFAVTSSQLGLLCLFLLVSVWIMAGVNHLTSIQQTAAMLIFPSLVLISFGPYILRALIFPLFFFLLMIVFFENFLNLRLYIWILVFVLIFAYEFYKKFFSIKLNSNFYNEDPNKMLLTRNARWLIPTLIAISMIVMSPWLSNNIRAFYPIEKKNVHLIVPVGLGGWIGPLSSQNSDWLPQFSNASSIINVKYTKRFSPFSVDLFSAYYQSDRNIGDLLDKKNYLYNPMIWTAPYQETRGVTLSDSYSMGVVELLLENEYGKRLVWFWYYVLGIPTVDMNYMDILDKVRVISRFADGSGVIAISTPVNSDVEQARLELESFLKVMYPSFEILQRPEKILGGGKQK